MHADLVKLIDLQSKDAAVAEAERRLANLGQKPRGWIRRSSEPESTGGRAARRR